MEKCDACSAETGGGKYPRKPRYESNLENTRYYCFVKVGYTL